MDPTGRFWRLAGIAGFLLVFAVVAAQPLAVFASAAIGSLLVVRQWSFFAESTAADRSLTIDLDLPRTHVKQQETVPLTATATLAEPRQTETVVTVPVPLTASGPDRLTLRLPAGEQTATESVGVTFATAGTVAFEQPTVQFRSGDGLFTQTVRRGSTPSVIVEPRVPRNVHVGEGGNRVDAAFGRHRTGEIGKGIDPAEPREYRPGDDISDIDWKTTARQGEAYVREYEVESDRRTVLLFDHRESTATGPPGEQICDYLREVALAMVSIVEEYGDPVGFYSADSKGITNEFSPATETDQYRTIRTELRDIEPTTPRTATTRRQQSASMVPQQQRSLSADSFQVGATEAGANAATLEGDSSRFATQLRPYFSDAKQYVRRIEGEPLFELARIYAARLRGESQTFIFTTDSEPAQLREAVKIARGDAGHVVVFLAPQCLFGAEDAASLESAYDQYTAFEQFRKELTAIDRVTAYEVAPGDRLEAVLATGRERHR